MALSSFFSNKKDRDGKPLSEPEANTLANPAKSEEDLRATQSLTDTRLGYTNTFAATVNDNSALASRIDQIEAQMAQELLYQAQAQVAKGSNAHTATVAPVKSAATPQATPASVSPTPGDSTPAYESPTDILGATLDMQAMEIAASTMAPVIEEAAVLYANGQADLAVGTLQTALREDRLGSATQLAWQTLLELHQLLDQALAFEEAAREYQQRFDLSQPPVFYAPEAADGGPEPSPAGNEIRLPAVLDEQSRTQFERLKSLLANTTDVVINASAVKQVTPHGAHLMLRTLKAFKNSQYRLVLSGAHQLAGLIRASLEVGRRDPSDLLWLLLLELYALLGLQSEFEESSIDYCVTFEISPPAWEPAPDNLKPGATRAEPDAHKRYTDVPTPLFKLTGTLEGKATDVLEALRAHANRHERLNIDCRDLLRIDFAAAGNLMNLLFGFSALGKEIHFCNVNYLVAAMFVVMGITEVSGLQRRTL